jgi:formimidoylglutamate deiminase
MTERTAIVADQALLPDGWAAAVRIGIDTNGDIAAVEAGASDAGERVAGIVLPGMPNLHSHAFQRAMAGLAERAGAAGQDSFWTWRETMYGFVARLTPQDLRAIAAQLYVEMLKAGYTAVGEFHYLHHDPDGQPYADRAAMSEAVAAAAGETGIGLTHLPVLYQRGGFDDQAPGSVQRRFVTDTDDFLRLVEAVANRHAEDRNFRIGIALHSLRAVPPDALDAAVAAMRALDSGVPVHIHAAEQGQEVEDCLAWSGRRPVEWLLANAPVDARWCLIHATHMTDRETRELAASGAVAGLCPTTEANLGDGLFPLRAYLAAGGRIGIGSDSQVSVSPVEELRWLEYGQRLTARQRTIAAAPGGATGARLYRLALAGGAQALGRPIGAIAAGHRADLIVLDPEHPILAGRHGDAALDSFVFSGNACPIRHVLVGGRWLVRDGQHAQEDRIATAYRAVVRRLAA